MRDNLVIKSLINISSLLKRTLYYLGLIVEPFYSLLSSMSWPSF